MPGHDFFLSRELKKSPSGSFRRDPTPSEEREQQREQQRESAQERRDAYQSMADAGISSLGGQTTDDIIGALARESQRLQGFTPISQDARVESLANLPPEGRLTVTPASGTGIFGIDFNNLSLPTINPALGFIQGLGSTDTFFKNLATKGAEGLSSKDKVTLINLIDRLGTSPENLQNLVETYADKNDVPADDLFANFMRGYEDIESTVSSSGLGEYLDTKPEGFKDSLSAMIGQYETEPREGILFKDREVSRPTLQDVTDNLGTEGLQFLKVNNPQAYYALRPNDPDLANESFVSTNDKVADRRFNAKIMEARAEAMDRQSRQDANMGQGIMAASPALPGISVPAGGTVSSPTVTPNPVLTPVPVGVVTPTTTGITPFNINQFYASLPQYVQQGIMTPTNLSRFTDALRMFPGATV